ncbi:MULTISPECIES: response regulator transcription factor [Bradyrhizobium]|uniref:Response regulator n=3 Tax=Bradyrhizobium TaxID=374 RepID=A0A410VHX4_9BRAD|nr:MULTISPECIES: response regulator [Bradyrhizobium]MCG2632986.1 response regulator [Bradyrhizobium zhengyangense]MCG2645605.1 response regulator [Bradyrhizobium zhengyangense]MCG2673172.1 response regulator [Bradyrhizobium zhengyangense]MDN4988437.1 response regulator [Bradyrhizobium sp. WYCCWR 13022]MDN5006401.1 response regulator [Bradyrhizobium sp. WYCCWR 12677]
MPHLISIIDDDPSVRAATNNLLSSRGYDVQVFASAPEFLRSEVLAATSCVIADIQMPFMNGLELLRQMRNDGRQTPFIFITANAERSVRARAIEAGGICLLAKPFTTMTLINCLIAALEGLDDTRK